MRKVMNILAALALVVLVAAPAMARDQIRIVGSSTVYPFSSYVAEEFGATTKFQTPVVESTGSGGGHKLFGAGVGPDTPDITNSSRRIKSSELEKAKANGITKITEAMIGYDGIAIAQNKKNKTVDLSLKVLALAVMEDVPMNGKLVKNPYKYWSDIDKKLPKRPILFYGPPTTSGTRDAFEELVLHIATKQINKEVGATLYPKKYGLIRQDGVYVPAGENDNLIVQKLSKDKDAFGIFGYSFLEENGDLIQGAKIDGVEPVPTTISSGEYPISRSLYFYIKGDHVGVIPGLMDYVKLFMSEKMIGERGLLKRIGLIPLPEDVRNQVREDVLGLKPLTEEMLKH